jgi:Domain of unknown function (DUF5606)
MNLKDILSISGEPGLFKFIAQGRNAIIVEHLETKKRKIAHSSAKVSSLDDISIFTNNEDLSLSKVFDLIFEKEKGGPAIDSKSDVIKLKSYFEELLPEYDKDRVYVSDIKKVILWYNILQKLGQLVKDEPESAKDIEKDSGTDIKSETKPKPKPKVKAIHKPGDRSAGRPESKSASTLSKGRPKSK